MRSRSRLLALLAVIGFGLLLWWAPWKGSSSPLSHSTTSSLNPKDSPEAELSSPEGRATRELHIEVLGCEGPAPAEVLFTWGQQHQRVVTDEQGRATFFLPATSLRASTKVGVHQAQAMVLPNQTTLRLEACQPAELKVRVLDLRLLPMVDTPIQLLKGQRVVYEARTDADGWVHFQIKELDLDTLMFERLQPLKPFRPNEVRELTLYNGMRSVRGWVLNHDGDPVSNAKVVLSVPNTLGSDQIILSDADGSFLFTATPPSALLLHAEHEEFGHAELTLAETFARADRTVTLHLAPQAWLTVRLPPGLSGRPIRLLHHEGDHDPADYILADEDAYTRPEHLWGTVRSNGYIPKSSTSEKLTLDDFDPPPEDNEDNASDEAEAASEVAETHDDEDLVAEEAAPEDKTDEVAQTDEEASDSHTDLEDFGTGEIHIPGYGEVMAYAQEKVEGLNGDETLVRTFPYDPPQGQDIDAILASLGSPRHRTRLSYLSYEDIELSSARTIPENERIAINARTQYSVQVLVHKEPAFELFLAYDCGSIDVAPGEEAELNCALTDSFTLSGQILTPTNAPVPNLWLSLDCDQHWSYLFRTNASGHFEITHPITTPETCILNANLSQTQDQLLLGKYVTIVPGEITDLGNLPLTSQEEYLKRLMGGVARLGGMIMSDSASIRVYVPEDEDSALFRAGAETNAVIFAIDGEYLSFDSSEDALGYLQTLESPTLLIRNPSGEFIELTLEPGWRDIQPDSEADTP